MMPQYLRPVLSQPNVRCPPLLGHAFAYRGCVERLEIPHELGSVHGREQRGAAGREDEVPDAL